MTTFAPTSLRLAAASLAGLALSLPPASVQEHRPTADTRAHLAHGHIATRHTLTLDGGRAVLDAGVAEARRLGVGGAFAVVDASGELLCLARVDGTFGAASNVATGKARTAVRFHKETRLFEESINGGRTALVGMPDFTPLQGGVPIVIDGHVVGAIGVSGASSARQDEELALVAIRALVRTP